MTGDDFLTVAERLAREATEADWRSAVSRAYYAVFHAVRVLFQDLGFVVPRADRCHAYLHLRLHNCGDAQMQFAGLKMNDLRQFRNQADYDLHRAISQTAATGYVRIAASILQILAALQIPTRTQITDAMKVYERDVLWQP